MISFKLDIKHNIAPDVQLQRKVSDSNVFSADEPVDDILSNMASSIPVRFCGMIGSLTFVTSRIFYLFIKTIF